MSATAADAMCVFLFRTGNNVMHVFVPLDLLVPFLILQFVLSSFLLMSF